MKAEDLYPIFARECCDQELNMTDRWIPIPDEVREMYKYYRSTPLVRAYGLEKALGTSAHIYFKTRASRRWDHTNSTPPSHRPTTARKRA